MGYLIATVFALALLSLPIGYIWLCTAMRKAAIQHPPYVHFFFVFGAVGSFVISIAFVGSVPGAFVALISGAVAPLVILVSSCILYRRHRDSRFHRAAFWSGLAYAGLITLIGVTMLCISS